MVASNQSNQTANSSAPAADETDTTAPTTPPTKLTFCDYGPDAARALRDAIDRSREHHPFRCVSIVAPTFPAGGAAKKEMTWAAARDGTTQQGLFGLRLFTPQGLADHIISMCQPGAYQSSHPNQVRLAALMALNKRDFPAFENIWSHPSTYEVLLRSLKELERLSPQDFDQLRKEYKTASHTAEPLKNLLDINDQLQKKFNQHSNTQHSNTDQPDADGPPPNAFTQAIELLNSKEDSLQLEHLREHLGALVVFLPQHLTTLEAKLLRTCQPFEIIMGLTRNTSADEVPLASLAKIDPSYPKQPPPAHDDSGSQINAQQVSVLSAPTAASEVRQVVQEVAAALSHGHAADQLTIAYTTENPYKQLLIEQLRASKISFTHPVSQPLNQCLAPQALLSMLDLLDHDFPRLDLMNLLTSFPIVNPATGERAPATTWDRLSREAMIYAGFEQWRDRLRRRQEIYTAEKSELDPNDQDFKNKQKNLDSKIDEIPQLWEFVESLKTSLDNVKNASYWQDKAAQATELLETYLPQDILFPDSAGQAETPATATADETSSALIQTEENAYTTLLSFFEQLGALDNWYQNPSHKDFCIVLRQKLEDSSGRLGDQNIGVTLTDTNTMLTGAFSHVWMLGLVEGHLPQKRSQDSILPESVREKFSDLTRNITRGQKQHRHFLAALNLATKKLALSYPRLAPQGGDTSLPSRWLLELIESFTGDNIFAEKLDDYIHENASHRLGEPAAETAAEIAVEIESVAAAPMLAFNFIDSFTSYISSQNLPTSEQDWNLRHLLPHTGNLDALSGCQLAGGEAQTERLKLGLEALSERASSEFTRFDGNLTHCFGKLSGETAGSSADPAGIFEGRISATRLEKWAECPQCFFVESVLRPAKLPEQEEDQRITPLVRGNIIHKALEVFYQEMLDNGTFDQTVSWDASHIQRMDAIVKAECDNAITNFEFGEETYYDQEIRRFQAELRDFLQHDQLFRQRYNCQPSVLEFEFGVSETFAFDLGDGKILRLRGRIDRLDTSQDGKICIIDYKTGKHSTGDAPHRIQDLSPEDPVLGGRRLQMPIYLKAAQAVAANQPASEAQPAGTGAQHETIYWFVNSKAEFHQQSLVFDAAVTKKTESAMGIIYEEIAKGVFPPGLHQAKNKDTTAKCEWCNADGFLARNSNSSSKTLSDIARKIESPRLQTWRSLAYPIKEKKTDQPNQPKTAKQPAQN